ncbi:acyl-CoA thioesterase [Tomitella gaofuii]|uniref:acyl-CoA thioesterase n=1 Tax=Tomitella gaofuii TaxID=2760083 RepID=UPI0015FA3540|nr:thioesterase family protein [Tomitella gaofuii]
MPQNTHPLDASLELAAGDDGTCTGATSAAYANMVGPFGGNTAAVLLRAAERHPERIGEPVALTVNFAGPVADGAFTVTARPTRTNRSTQHWSIELSQDGVVATTATAVFAVRRDTWAADEAVMPQVPGPDEVPALPMPPFIKWADNYEFRWVVGGIPQPPADGEAPVESDDSTTTMWVRDMPPRPLDFAALTGICDSFYPRAFLRRGTALPAGTVTFTVYFHADAEALARQGSEPVLATARAKAFGKGYFDQVAEIWGTDGTLLATSHQLVYFKA